MPVVRKPHLVTYDPSLPSHLNAYKLFFQTGSWSHTDLRFDIEHPYLDVPTTLQNKTLEYFFFKDTK